MEEIIKLVDVKKSFNKNLLLTNIDLSINKGQIVGIFGVNGSGKSVLFKLISGIYKADSGDVFIRGKKIGLDIDFAENTGISIDSPGFIEHISGFKNLRYLAYIKNILNDEDINMIMEKVGLDPYLETKVRNYSIGMKQKLSLAQAVMEDQDIIILDEPFNGLDTQSYKKFINILFELKSNGKTILLTSHNNNDMYELCDTIYEIKNKTLNLLQ